MVLVISLLMESLPTELADVRLVSLVDPVVGVEGGTPVEGLAAGETLVRLLVGVDDLVPAKRRCLTEPLPAHLAHKRPGA